MDTTNSQELYQRAKTFIPRGIAGHYGYAVGERSPVFFKSSAGSRFTDIDGNSYIDLVCAYGPMILGYNHPAVEEAATAQMAEGNTVSLASPVLVDLAEHLVGMVHGGDWTLFGKNGADSTSLAVMVARAATGKRYVLKVDNGYHGSAAWMQPPGSNGTIDADHDLVLSVPWNDVEAFRSAIDEHGHDIACFISSPYHHPVFQDNALPADGYWKDVESMCRAAGIVLILDDVRSGFRIDLAGSHAAYGFQPDLMCFGKALGNGHPIAALVGVESLRAAATDTFYTGTQFFNAGPMAAALATIKELERIDGANRITETAQRLNRGLTEVAAAHGHELKVSGVPAMPYYRLIGEEGHNLHRRWVEACVQGGVYLLDYHNNFVSAAHDEHDIQTILDVADRAFVSLGT